MTTPPPGWITDTSVFDEDWAELNDPTTAYVEVTQSASWSWCLVLTHSGMECGSWIVLGSHARAKRVAARKLARYRRSVVRRSERFRVT